MNGILELLKNTKVEWKTLGEVCFSITTGLNPRKNFRLNDETDGFLTSWYVTTKDYSVNEKIEFVEGKTAKITEKARVLINKRSKLAIYDILFSAVGTVGKIAFVEKNPINFDVNESTFVLKPNQNYVFPKYLLYYLRSSSIQDEIKKSLKGGTVLGIRKDSLEHLDIPIPPIELQKEIVRILDTFSELIAELQAELQAELILRQKQYEYYLNMLLSEEYLKECIKKMEKKEEYKLRITTLGEIGKFTRGNGLQKKDFKKEGKPVVHYGQIYTTYGFTTEKVFSYVDDEVFSKLRKAKTNYILIATTSENIKDLAKCVVWMGEEEVGFSGDMCSYSTEENAKYIAYYFQTYEFQKQKNKKITGTKLMRIHADDMEKFKITLPPIEIQEKIVKVLDKFEELIEQTKGALPEEIEARQKQYEYYREALLTFNGKCARERERERELTNQFFIILNEAAQIVGVDLYSLEKKKLGEMAQCCDGIHQTPKYADSGVPFISVKNIKNIYETQQYISKKDFKEFKFKPEKGDVFMTRIGDIGTCAVVQNDEDLAYYVTLTLIKPNRNIILGGFIKYFIESDYGRKELDKRTLHKAIPIKINLGDVKQLELPLPPLSVQEHVVSILDKFSEIANDLEQGLPAEINLRQKQYEYYRNLLLSFPNQN